MEEKLKKYQVVVNGQRNTSTVCPVEPYEYHVQAKNRSDAREKALAIFHRANPDMVNVIASKGKQGNIPAIVCLTIACFISFIPWHIGSVVFSLAQGRRSSASPRRTNRPVHQS
jgi:hypothetical protein